MNVSIFPGKSLHGEITIPGDKSISHRAILLAALADGDCEIRNFLFAGVTKVMLEAIHDLGVAYEINGTTLIIHGRGAGELKPPEHPINCGNSATTLRLLAGFLAATGLPAVLDGTPGLRRRPMDRIVEPLAAMGVPVRAAAGGMAPLTLGARSSRQKLLALSYTLHIASAQVKSCLLLASLAAQGTCHIKEPGPSRDHTERFLRNLGIQVKTIGRLNSDGTGNTVTLEPPPNLSLPPFSINIPGDFSSAAFLIVGATITKNSELVLRHVGLNPTRTGLADALMTMGANVQITDQQDCDGEPVGNILVRSTPLVGVQVNGDLVVRMIDEFPAFAIGAAFARGITTVSNAEELRHKESDRISSLAEECRSLGVQLDEKPDGFVICGKEHVSGGTVDPHGDHRLAMALSIAGLAADEPLTVKGAEIVSESYPAFFSDLVQLGARFEMDAI